MSTEPITPSSVEEVLREEFEADFRETFSEYTPDKIGRALERGVMNIYRDVTVQARWEGYEERAKRSAALQEKVERERAFLEAALDQALSYGVIPSLPSPKPIYANEPEWAEAYADYDERHFPYGEATVEFFHSDECSYPQNCPELAAYIRNGYSVPALSSPTNEQEGDKR